MGLAIFIGLMSPFEWADCEIISAIAVTNNHNRIANNGLWRGPAIDYILGLFQANITVYKKLTFAIILNRPNPLPMRMVELRSIVEQPRSLLMINPIGRFLQCAKPFHSEQDLKPFRGTKPNRKVCPIHQALHRAEKRVAIHLLSPCFPPRPII